MHRGWFRVALLAGTIGVILAASPAAHAIHFYRSTAGGCSAADGARTDDPAGTIPRVRARVVLGHNAFGKAGTGFSVRALRGPHMTTRIRVGDSVTWTWNSAHCHSVTSNDFSSGTTRLFDSGYLYPATPPESPRVLPGLFDYPKLDKTPTLSYTHTFTTPGTYNYFCVHHASIGMNGVVVVS